MARRSNNDGAVLVKALFKVVKALLGGIVGAHKAVSRSRSQRSSNQPTKSSSTRKAQFTPAFVWDTDDSFEFEIVGESFYQDELRLAAGDHGNSSANVEVDALMVPEDDNEHDDKAVAIYVMGRKVGHMSKVDARKFRRRLSTKKVGGQVTQCRALITGGGLQRSTGERYHYGISLGIKPFSED